MTSTDVYGTDAGGRLVVRRVSVEVVDGPDAGASAVLQAGSLVLGTAPSVDMKLRDRRVSRAHVEISMTDRGLVVRDLDSTNGTFVGAMRVHSVVVEPPVELRLGDTRLRIRPDDIPAPTLPEDRRSFGPLVGESLAMRRVFATLERVAGSDVPVMVEGESGVGKTSAALAIHAAGPRASRPLHALDVGGPELHVRELIDVLRAARGGTVLLERAHRMHGATTSALQQAIDAAEQEGSPARLLATSELDTRELSERGTLPRALYFRLAGVRIAIPPLRDRPEDVPVLIRALAAELDHAGELSLSESELVGVHAHEMSGNVRQLRNVVEHALASAAAPDPAGRRAARPLPPPPSVAGLTYKDAKERVMQAFEREYLRDLLERHGQNLASAAREAGIVRHHFHALARKHGLR